MIFTSPYQAGHTRHTDRTQVGAERHVGGVHLAQGAGLVAVHHAVLLPAAHTDHLVAHGVLRVA
jgi:hypothetical protein